MDYRHVKKFSRIMIIMLAVMFIMLTLSSCSSDNSSMAGLANFSDDTVESFDDVVDDSSVKESETAEELLNRVPEWSGCPYTVLNGNHPNLTEEDIYPAEAEHLDDLDDLGRCGTNDALIGTAIMPDGERGSISEIHPTGWHDDRYDFIDGQLLFNRCHLIGWQLTGNDAIDRNLITGTRYMNVEGMLPFENAIANYVKSTEQHVMYRVQPVFSGSELVARGVHLEAYSVEDDGEGICFNVFCYNIQPGVIMDYATGDNELNPEQADRDVAATFTAAGIMAPVNGAALRQFELYENDMGDIDAGEETSEVDEDDAEKAPVLTYVLNTNTKKFHYEDCNSVNRMKDENKKIVTGTRDEVEAMGYQPCGNCHP